MNRGYFEYGDHSHGALIAEGNPCNRDSIRNRYTREIRLYMNNPQLMFEYPTCNMLIVTRISKRKSQLTRACIEFRGRLLFSLPKALLLIDESKQGVRDRATMSEAVD